MNKYLLSVLMFFVLLFSATPSFASHDVENISAEEALEKLKLGNKHFVEMKMEHPDCDKERRKEMLKGQHPFAVVVSCSDSRVPLELIFDQGLGDIFEIKNAGNILDEHVIGSIEYAVVHLGVKLVVIMGHQDCGAVTAAVNHSKESKHIKSLVKTIEPAVKKAEKQEGCLLDNAIKLNAQMSAKNLLEEDKVIAKYVKTKNVKIIPAYYHLDTGKVDFGIK